MLGWGASFRAGSAVSTGAGARACAVLAAGMAARLERWASAVGAAGRLMRSEESSGDGHTMTTLSAPSNAPASVPNQSQAARPLVLPGAGLDGAISERTKLIMIASPNNPTGATVSRAQLLAIANAAPNAVLMVDEAYFHFHGDTVMNDIATTPNLVAGRTFSKAYGLANLRIGLLAGNAELLKYLRKVSSPYNVNGVALDCLSAALEDDAYLCWYAEQVLVGRERMMGGLDELGVSYFPSAANFVLMKIGPKHAELATAMRKHGVLVRDRSADPGCDGYVRITIGVEDQVTRGLEALKASLNEIGWKPTRVFSADGTIGTREFE